jgi:hypothetical protein
VALTATVRDALSQLLAAGGAPLTVVDDKDHVAGLATLELLGGLLGNGALPDPIPAAEAAASAKGSSTPGSAGTPGGSGTPS